MDQPGKVANPARGQLNRENRYPCPRSHLRIWSRKTGSAVPSRISLLIFILRLNLVLTNECHLLVLSMPPTLSVVSNINININMSTTHTNKSGCGKREAHKKLVHGGT